MQRSELRITQGRQGAFDPLLVVALSLFVAFVVAGGCGGWEWFMTAGETRYEPRPLDRGQVVAVKQAPAQPF